MTIKHTGRIGAVLLATSLAMGHAGAALTSVDYLAGSGDGWITHDSATNQDWLDVSLTTNQTYDQIRTGSWVAQGFHIASQDEVQTLFNNAGIPADSLDHYTEALTLANLLGPTLVSGSRVGVAGFVSTDFFGNPVTLETHPIGQRFSALLGKVNAMGAMGSLPAMGMADFAQGQPFSDQADPYYGAYLVRTAVPEPGTSMLMLMGLAAVAGGALRKQRQR